jgi:ribonuclease VapC
MIVDTSALIAILRAEPDAALMAQELAGAECVRLSTANFVEAAAVIDGSQDPIASRRYDDLLREAGIVLEPVTEAQARLARQAYRDFGKGSGHPAQLNFGDCFAYALAKDVDEPLLYKGTDFAATDVASVVQPDRR